MKNTQNRLIIMAGGIGSRFWPFSRQAKPKQFLDFFGTGKTLLQMTIDRYRGIVPIENILIVTNAAYKDIILEQVPEMRAEQVLLEPCRRNTAPCIAYAVARIQKEVQGSRYKVQSTPHTDFSTHPELISGSPTNNHTTNIIVAASDHLITDEVTFRETISLGLDYISTHNDILTLGMRPTRPETGYGYIKVESQKSKIESQKSKIESVEAFREKPDLETAKEYLADGNYLWNSGMFMFNLETIVSAFQDYLPEVWQVFDEAKEVLATPTEQEYITQHFPLCQNISIDYGIMEKATNVKVLPSDFGWSDLGNWGSLYDLSEKDKNDNVTIHSAAEFYDAQNNIVTLEKGKLAVIRGLNDYIVAETEGVLLICPRQDEQEIKNIVTDIQAKHPEKN